jgi:hypothetical protein
MGFIIIQTISYKTFIKWVVCVCVCVCIMVFCRSSSSSSSKKKKKDTVRVGTSDLRSSSIFQFFNFIFISNWAIHTHYDGFCVCGYKDNSLLVIKNGSIQIKYAKHIHTHTL